jgi:hypothetical protein
MDQPDGRHRTMASSAMATAFLTVVVANENAVTVVDTTE